MEPAASETAAAESAAEPTGEKEEAWNTKEDGKQEAWPKKEAWPSPATHFTLHFLTSGAMVCG